MCAGKGVTDIDITKRGKLRRKCRIIGLLARLKAQVFQHHNIAILHDRHRIPRTCAGNISHHRHIAFQQRGQRRCHRSHRHVRHLLALWPAEMCQDHQTRARLEQRNQPRKHAPDTRVITNRTIDKRHIQIEPDKASFASRIDIINEQERGFHGMCPISGENEMGYLA